MHDVLRFALKHGPSVDVSGLNYQQSQHFCSTMLPIHKIIWHEFRAGERAVREPEPSEAMIDPAQIRAYVKAYEWGGPTSALQLHHLRELSEMIRPGDTVLDLACGPGPLLLELAPLYPECHFIGADLSQPMLDVLREQADERRLTNVEVICDDIRTLDSLSGRKVDLVITTSALHHLPDIDCLRATFARINRLIDQDGGFYVFDFGLLRSPRTRQIMVDDIAKKAPATTALDYHYSLRAAFPIDQVIELARSEIQRPFSALSSSFVDFFYFLKSGPRGKPSASSSKKIASLYGDFSADTKLEHMMLRAMRRAR